MFTRKRVIILAGLLLTFLTNGSAFAKGAPDKITIIGAGLSNGIEIFDAELLEPFALENIISSSTPIHEPKGLGTGYEITRYYEISGIGLKAIDSFVYYPDRRGHGGSVFYTGIVDKEFIYGGSPLDGKWLQPSPEADLAVQQISADYGIHPARLSPWQSVVNNYVVWLVLVGLVVVGIVVFFIALRMQRSPGLVT